MEPDRYEPLREIARAASVDAIALVPGANFTRLFGHDFHQNERPLVVVVPLEGAPVAIVPNLELASFNLLEFEGEVFDWRDQVGYPQAFDALFASLSERSLYTDSIGVEGQSMRVFVDQALRSARPGLRVVDLNREIAALRLCKDAFEVAALREAIRISEQALAETLAAVRVGQTETAIESILVQRLFANGAEEMSFPPIVAAADNSALPHASARADYAVRDGDALLFDFGAVHGGLRADITRTVFVGRCDERQRDIYSTVLAALRAGHDAVRPGATAHDVDDAATAVLEASPYADRVRTKTGHGLGRDVHEDPYIMRGNPMLLEPGMVFTIEPGLYGIDDFGVRIEDDVLVTDTGCESLTSYERELTVVDPVDRRAR